jgi:hypothetical protein
MSLPLGQGTCAYCNYLDLDLAARIILILVLETLAQPRRGHSSVPRGTLTAIANNLAYVAIEKY